MPCHPETRKESEGKLKHEGCDVRRKGQKGNMSIKNEIPEVENLTLENEMVENIVQHPLQNKVHAATGRIAEQFEAHHLAEGQIEKVDDRGQSAFYPGFYVFQG